MWWWGVKEREEWEMMDGGGVDGAVGRELMEEAVESKERVAWEVMEVVVRSMKQL